MGNHFRSSLLAGRRATPVDTVERDAVWRDENLITLLCARLPGLLFLWERVLRFYNVAQGEYGGEHWTVDS